MSDIFWEVHSNLPREAPGSEASTRTALTYITDLPKEPAILDVGCGTGPATLVLARETGGHVAALDNHRPFLAQLKKTAETEGLSERVELVHGTMFDLPFEDNSFDLIWSEGAIYIVGFAAGLSRWWRLLRPKGVVAVTEVSWLKNDPPETISKFWKKAYPGIATVAENLAAARSCGYDVIAHFTLPESDWWEYYRPMQERIEELRKKHRGNDRALDVLDDEYHEIRMYREYSEWYGYVFYVLRKRDS